MARFVPADRDQPFLPPPDLRDWLPEDDLAHFVLEAVERVSVDRFKVNDRGRGRPSITPDDVGLADLPPVDAELLEQRHQPRPAPWPTVPPAPRPRCAGRASAMESGWIATVSRSAPGASPKPRASSSAGRGSAACAGGPCRRGVRCAPVGGSCRPNRPWHGGAGCGG